MEMIYLLISILTTTATSIALSLLLPFRHLFSNASKPTPPYQQHLYKGTVYHERRRPVHHSFTYSVRYALVDLDRAPHAPPDHLNADEARKVASTTGSVFLLTIPPSVGYEQNPLSVYYCYDEEGATQSLKKCIAEVTNTPWGERVLFLFNPNSDLVAKPLHVSPFMDMFGNWSIRTTAPGDDLFIKISVQHPKLGDYFTASLKAKRCNSTVADHSLFFWLMPHKVAFWIYWEALKLWWKNVPFIQHPRYEKPMYRDDALTRDRSLGCQAVRANSINNQQSKGYVDLCDRWFKWRDAKWPWC